jgi:hypothetical protein
VLTAGLYTGESCPGRRLLWGWTPLGRGRAQLMGGDGTVPLMFFFRDHDGNQLMIVQAQ